MVVSSSVVHFNKIWLVVKEKWDELCVVFCYSLDFDRCDGCRHKETCPKHIVEILPAFCPHESFEIAWNVDHRKSVFWRITGKTKTGMPLASPYTSAISSGSPTGNRTPTSGLRIRRTGRYPMGPSKGNFKPYQKENQVGELNFSRYHHI